MCTSSCSSEAYHRLVHINNGTGNADHQARASGQELTACRAPINASHDISIERSIPGKHRGEVPPVAPTTRSTDYRNLTDRRQGLKRGQWACWNSRDTTLADSSTNLPTSREGESERELAIEEIDQGEQRMQPWLADD